MTLIAALALALLSDEAQKATTTTTQTTWIVAPCPVERLSESEAEYVRVSEPQVIPEREPQPCPSPKPTPPPPPRQDFEVDGAIGGAGSFSSAETTAQPLIELAMSFDVLEDARFSPRVHLLARFAALPDQIASAPLWQLDTFRSINLEGSLSQPIGIRLKPAIVAGFESRLGGDFAPLHRTTRYVYGGLRVDGPGGYLFAGIGGDERVSARPTPEYVPAFTTSWRVRVTELDDDVWLYLAGRAVLYLRIGYYERRTIPDQVLAGLMIGWGRGQAN